MYINVPEYIALAIVIKNCNRKVFYCEKDQITAVKKNTDHCNVKDTKVVQKSGVSSFCHSNQNIK